MQKSKATEEGGKNTLIRCYNMLQKLLKNAEAANTASSMKHLVFKTVLFTTGKWKGELQMNALRTLHPILRSPGFAKRAIGELGLTIATFNNIPNDLVILFNEALK
jgi:hypothetical protein